MAYESVNENNELTDWQKIQIMLEGLKNLQGVIRGYDNKGYYLIGIIGLLILVNLRIILLLLSHGIFVYFRLVLYYG